MQDGSTPIVVPGLLCPVTPAISPYAAQLDLESVDWARNNGLCPTPDRLRRLAEARFGTLAARICPDADVRRLSLYVRWWTFGFFYADEFFTGGCGEQARRAAGERDGVEPDPGACDSRRRTAADAAMATVSAVVPGGMPSGMPRLEHIHRLHRLDLLAQLLSETAELCRCEQLSRFGTALNLRLSRHLQHPPSPAGPDVLSRPCLVLGEIIGECPVSAAELADEDVARLTALAGQRITWCDRLHSAVRRDSYGELVAGLPVSLRLGTEAHPQRALDRAARVHDEAARAYLRLEQTLSASASPGVRAYLRLLSTWIRGHHDWCRETLPAFCAGPEPLDDVRLVLGPAATRVARAPQGC